MNEVCNLLGTKYPIIQGAMARIAEHNLAAAVSQAGGLGIIASGGADARWLREEIRRLREKTDRPFGVNLMLMMPNIDELIEVVCAEGVPVVTTGAGNPGKYMARLKSAGVKVIPVVASVALAVRVERAGADGVICEGTEAGGHIGELTTMALVPQVVDAVSIPVIAAGGIGDGRGLAAAFMLGARGVQLGTRFVVCDECIVSENYKEAILKAKDTDTCATGRSTGHPVRVIKNKLARRMLQAEKEKSGQELQGEIDKLGIGALSAAVYDGDMENGSIMSGQIAGLVKKTQPAGEMIEEIFQEAQQVLGSTRLNLD